MVGSLMRNLMGSITGVAGTEAVGLTRSAQFDLALAAHAEFIICNQSIDEVFLTINGAAKREILSGVEHRQSRYLNNRCENSYRPTRQREYRMQGFKSAGHAQRFLSAY